MDFSLDDRQVRLELLQGLRALGRQHLSKLKRCRKQYKYRGFSLLQHHHYHIQSIQTVKHPSSSPPPYSKMENLPVDHFVTNMQFTAQTHRDIYAAIDPTTISQKGKVVIITGASQGLGAKAFAPSFAAAGPKAIVLVARNADKLQEVADTLAKSFPDVETLVVPTDIGNPASVAALFEKVKERYGYADVLVNNAAVFEADQLVKDVDQQLWWDEMVSFLRLIYVFTAFTFAPPSPFSPLSPFSPPSPF